MEARQRPAVALDRADSRGTGKSQEPAERPSGRRVSADGYGLPARHADDAIHAGKRRNAWPRETYVRPGEPNDAVSTACDKPMIPCARRPLMKNALSASARRRS